MDEPVNCSPNREEPFEGSIGLRIGAIFIILVTSAATTLFPVITRRLPRAHVPDSVFDFARYFGSGVIIATSFIHLLAPGTEELTSPCLNANFQVYPFSFAFAMIAAFMTFFVEIMAFRFGSKKAEQLAYNGHAGGHHHPAEHGTVPPNVTEPLSGSSDVEKTHQPKDVGLGSDIEEVAVLDKDAPLSAAASQIIGVLILEFGVIFHSVIIGITLGTTTDFTILFIVIIFHQMFEGLGLGSRLATLPISRKSLIPYIGCIAYALVTPIGLAIGLGVRTTYNEDSARANYVTGIFDSFSAGILIYTGMVHCLAHDMIMNDKFRTLPMGRLLFNIFTMLLGAGLMALLGRWA
ncbi:ZIP zinc/iron transport family [Ceraceosorus guamensis]|uniref:ZIP zinc/iron transport family n=1 Tax=Ceraceosorus guamensis TaxID=1522189 RepID=A0A316VX76_9BASI|nr:ZIP zinc/iron transport family [Ceraceosorus guamensis]PWN40085.1 ZIP zinc/iron transport family [Ceraceosorus guamensis]